MSDYEKGAMVTIDQAMKHMTEYDRGYFVGFAKALLSAQQQRKKAEDDIPDEPGRENAPESEAGETD